MSDLGERIGRLSPQARARLEAALISGRAGGVSDGGIALRSARDQPTPLSFGQERLWFLHQLDPDSPLHNIPWAVRLRGPLDRAALQRALEAFIARHAVLRTRFAFLDGNPVQLVTPPSAPAPLATIDLRATPLATRDADLERHLRAESARPFDLARDLLLRALVLDLGPADAVLLLVAHHIAFDGWSLGVLFKELAALYEAFSHDRPSPLPDLPLQYADYAVWQRQTLQGPALTGALSYWAQQLTGAPPLLDLPTDHPRPPAQTYRGAQLPLVLPAPLVADLRALSRREGATLFMTLLAAFQALLHRLSGQTDIVVGSPIAGRVRPELEPLVGVFLNTLALRTSLADDPSFHTLLARVRQTTLDAFEHQSLPFEQLVEELRPARSLSHAPLIQVMFALNNANTASLQLPGLLASPIPVDPGTSEYDLTLSLRETPDGLRGRLQYSTDLFDAATIHRLGDHFLTLVTGLVADPAKPVSALPLLSERDRHQLLVEWNASPRAEADLAPDVHPHACLHDLLEAQAARSPDALAAVFEGASLTYRALHQRANQLAHLLRARGAGPDIPVGLCLERSLDLLVGLLGILKAGAAYLPLDPSYPAARLAFMLTDAQAPVLVTHSTLRDLLPGFPGSTICLDADGVSIAQQPDTPPPAGTTPDHLAYVIYTSGSTGQPKGVQIPHRALVNLLLSMSREPGLAPSDCLLAVTPFSFDIAALELFLPLLVGARVVIARRQVAADGALLVDHLALHGVTVMQATPATWRLMLDAGWSPTPTLTILCGGEALSPDLATALCRRSPRVWNLYGPTETTIWSTLHRVTASGDPVPIGRPIANTELYVLDAHQHPVPIGVPGELYIGGVGLARGYLNRPKLTAEAFVPHVLGGEAGARLYKTGDRVRYRPDGTLLYLGRLDQQVKLRGVRVELGEIEAALEQHPRVRHAVAALREDAAGDPRLVAYLVAHDSAELAPIDLRDHLRQILPASMIPAAFIPLAALPLTPSGKVDRPALPAPSPDLASARPDFAPPTTPTEQLLAQIWGDLLGLSRVGVHDNFFDLGGHSLLALRVLARLRDAVGADWPVRALFEAPTIAQLAALLTDAGTRSDGGPGAAQDHVPRESDAGPCALSFAQQRLWFLNQLAPEGPLHNIACAVRLQGPLDRPALQHAFDELVARHGVLRTCFAVHNGSPVQLVTSPPLPIPLASVDLRAAPPAAREGEFERLCRAEASRPFDLAGDPLLRIVVFDLALDEAVLLLVIHHIAADGWSLGVLFQELAALYAAFSHGRPSPLSPLPLQYADYAVWQRQVLTGPALSAQRAYWTQQLAGAPPLLELPTDRPRPAVQTYRGALHVITLPAALTADLLALSRREDVTLFMTLLAAFQTLLHRLSGQADVVVASPIAGRSRRELEPLVGVFVNHLALRTSLADDPSFRALLARVRHVTLGAYDHPDLPFEQLVEELHPQRSLGHAPLAQVMFVLQNTAPIPLALPGLLATPIATDTGASEFDVSLFLRETPEGLRGVWQYSTDLFDAPTIARLAGHFSTLLHGIVADPEQRLSGLPLLTAAERQQLLVEWNATQADYPQNQCLHRLVEAQVARTPEAVAVLWNDQSLAYGELDTRANQLAHHLQGLGVGPEVLVGVCLERSPDLVIALLGILKAGGAYVPLDPAYPRERLAFMLEDARVSVVVTHQHLVRALPARGPHTVCLDTDAATLDGASTTHPVSPVHPDNLAYVIYTSGSTGQPKGVLGLHRGTVNRFQWMYERYPFVPGDVCCQKTSVNFVDSVWEIFGPLAHGVPLVIIPDDVLQDPAQLVDTLAARRVTRLVLVPSLLRVILESDAALDRRLPDLELWICSGEALSVDLVQMFRQRLPQRRLLNLYGASEVSADSTFYEVPTDRPLTAVPIGRPIANTQLYVLDAHQHPAPIGVPGELYIGGPGLARGYLHRPDLTAQHFIAHPFSTEVGTRLYKTGDRVRYRPDGTLLYLGRLDQQVKVRGVRIELGEIEAALEQHPGVRHAVAALREDAAGEPSLVVYLVAHDNAALAPTALRDYLRQTLPASMIPAAFVPLPTLPLTPSGKVDRPALPAPSPDLASARPDFAPPTTPTEQLLAQIWCDLLGLPHVGVHDNFFDLGGHSLLALRVLARLRDDDGADWPVRALFEAPTIAQLAALLTGARTRSAGGAGAAHDSIPRRSGEAPCALSFSQQRLWFLSQLAPESPLHNIASTVRLQGRLDRPALQQALDALVERHHALRTTFAFHDGRPLQLIAPPRPAALAVIDLQTGPSATRETALEHHLADQGGRLFDLTRDLLLRAVVIQLAADQCVLLLVIHHIAADGWSLGVLFQELAALYAAFSHGRPFPLPPLPLQYADYAVWQRQVLTGPALSAQRAYWAQQLAGAPPLLELPTDRPRPAVQTYRGALHVITLPAALTADLLALSRREDVTLFMTLLAAFQTLLHRLSGQADVVVASPIAGRSRRELEPLVGVFVNHLALRTSLADDPSFRALLARVRHVTLGAYDHPDLPFEQLVEELHPQRSLGHAPLAQVMFVLHNTAPIPFTLPGLRATPVATDTGASEFDLALFLRETRNGLRVVWQYSTDLFDTPTMASFAGHFSTLLHGIVADPTQPLSALPLLTDAERQQLLVEWNATQADYPHDLCLHQLVEAQVARTPEAVAVLSNDQSLAYGELDTRANQLAHHLQSLGVGPEVLVGVCLERSPDLVIALLGILKAGGAYVPLDPAYPRERLAFMLEDARVSVVVTHQHLVRALPARGPHTVCLDTDAATLDGASTTHPVSPVHPDNLAYVIYTSGSTGQPKGVLGLHRGTLNRFQWMYERYPFVPGDVCCQKTSVNFVDSVWEIFGPLAHGVPLVIIPDAVLQDPAQLVDTLAARRVTRLVLVPSLLRVILESDAALDRRLPDLELWICSGEALSVDLVQMFRQRLPQRRLLNLYGASEVSADSTFYEVPTDRPLTAVPIGRPIANTELYVLDAHQHPVPIGVPGELYIAGVGLARGYLHRPELTAATFVPHLFSDEAGARLFKTGDRVRSRPDGTLLYLGRLDQQVKLRGVRIELGELEAALEQHPAVRHAVAALREDAAGDPRLVAYLVAHPGTAVAPTDLRDYLRQQLPAT